MTIIIVKNCKIKLSIQRKMPIKFLLRAVLPKTMDRRICMNGLWCTSLVINTSIDSRWYLHITYVVYRELYLYVK